MPLSVPTLVGFYVLLELSSSLGVVLALSCVLAICITAVFGSVDHAYHSLRPSPSAVSPAIRTFPVLGFVDEANPVLNFSIDLCTSDDSGSIPQRSPRRRLTTPHPPNRPPSLLHQPLPILPSLPHSTLALTPAKHRLGPPAIHAPPPLDDRRRRRGRRRTPPNSLSSRTRPAGADRRAHLCARGADLRASRGRGPRLPLPPLHFLPLLGTGWSLRLGELGEVRHSVLRRPPGLVLALLVVVEQAARGAILRLCGSVLAGRRRV